MGASPLPGMTPRAGGSPGASPAALAPQSPAARDVALLQMIVDPENPLKLTDADREALRQRLLWVADAHERVNFRKRAIHDAAPELWRTATKPGVSKERDAEEAFLKDASEAEAALRQKAGPDIGQAVTLPAHIPAPGTPPEEKPDADPASDTKTIDAVDLQMLGVLLTQMGAEATPEQARKILPEVASLKEYVRDLEVQYDELWKVVKTPDREVAVLARAAKLPWEDVDLSLAQTRAMNWADDLKDK